MDLIAHLTRQRAFSERTFGPGERTAGVLDHIRKELREIEAHPRDLSEWIDVVLLAFDGAWRHGYSPEEIADALAGKQARNEARTWPDWRTADPGKAIEHDRSHDAPPPAASPVDDAPTAPDAFPRAPRDAAEREVIDVKIGARWCQEHSPRATRNGGRYACVRAPGHGGDHIAAGGDEILARWPTAPATTTGGEGADNA